MRHPTKRITRVVIYVLLAVLAIIPFAVAPRLPVSAASGITLSSSVQVSFPTSMTFDVKAQGNANIVQLRLHYIVERQKFASVVSEGWA